MFVGLAEAVLLAVVEPIGDGQPLLAESRDDQLRLLRRHHPVLGALEDDQRRGQGVEVRQRRALGVHLATLGIGRDQAVEVARLELVRLPGKGLDVGDAVVVRAGSEHLGDRQRHQHGEAAGGPAADDGASRVDPALLPQPAHDSDTVVDVDDAPRPLEPVAVGPAVAGGAAVVHVDHGEAAARPELLTHRERGHGVRRGTPVDHHDQRWQLPLEGQHVGVGRPVEVRVRRQPAASRELDVLGPGEPLRADAQVPHRAEGLLVVPGVIDLAAPHRGLLDRGRADVDHRRTRGRDVGDTGAAHRQVADRGVALEQAQPVGALVQDREHDPAVTEEGIAPRSEDPFRLPHVPRLVEHLLDSTLGGPAVERPPVLAVGAEPQRAVGRPARLADALVGVVHAAGHGDGAHGCLDLEGRGVPRHVRVVPLQPRQRLAVGRPARVGDEVRPGGDRLGLPSGGEHHDLVDHVDGALRPRRVGLADHGDAPVRGVHVTVGPAHGATLGGCRGDLDGVRARIEPSQSLVRPVDVPERPVAGPTTRRRRTHGPGCGHSHRRAARRSARHRARAGPPGPGPPRAGAAPTSRRRPRPARRHPPWWPGAPRGRQ